MRTVTPRVGDEEVRRLQPRHVARVAQMDRAPDCGSGGCGFESHLSPQHLEGAAMQQIRFEPGGAVKRRGWIPPLSSRSEEWLSGKAPGC